MKKYLNLKWLIIVFAIGAKKKWLQKQIEDAQIECNQFLGLFLFPADEKETLYFIMPNDFLFTNNAYFKNQCIEAESIELAKEKAISPNYTQYLAETLNYIKENMSEYDITVFEKDYDICIRFLNANTQEVIARHVVNKNNAEEIETVCKDFIHEPIKMRMYSLEKFRDNIKRKILNDFDIDTTQYDITLESVNDENCNVLLHHKKNKKKILINSVRYNERTGEIYFAGNSSTTMTL